MKKHLLIVFSITFCSQAFSMDENYTAQELGLSMSTEHFQRASKFEKDFHKAIQDYQKHQEVLDISKDKDIVIAIGNTGSGKSTLLNLLIGNQLQVVPNSLGYKLYNENNPQSFKIGLAGSETLLPKYVQENKLTFFDMPGLCDTRGEAVDFLNAIFMDNIITRAKSVRFLFIEGFGSLDIRRGANIRESLNKIARLLQGDKRQLKGSSMLVITKCDTSFQNTLVQNFTTRLTDLWSEISDLFSTGAETTYVFPFINSQQFVSENKEGSQTVDTVKAEETLGKTKKDIEEGITRLAGVKISKINASALLDYDIGERVHDLFKIITAKSLMPLFRNLDNLNGLHKSQLKSLRANAVQRQTNLLTDIALNKELKFVEFFDGALYNKELIQTYKENSDRITILLNKIDIKILESNISELEESNQKKESEISHYRSKFTESRDYRELCVRIDLGFTEIEAIKIELETEKSYLDDRSTAGTVFKGIFSLGTHTAYHWNRVGSLRSDYSVKKTHLEDLLKKYKINMYGQEHQRQAEFSRNFPNNL